LKYYSTKNKNKYYSFRESVLKGLPEDNGLFMPEFIPSLADEFIKSLSQKSIAEIGFETSRLFIDKEISQDVVESICQEAFNFEVKLVQLKDKTFICELFHGPTMAFKDFGARFMARVMSYLNRGEDNLLTILVATSGDTGSAVADGFYDVEGIEVFILYPSGGVSELQEKQLTTYGKNIHAIEVKGTFDDCQRMVKSAFLDDELSKQFRLTSANSINISRLIPQMIYYFYSFGQLSSEENIVFAVPSGNFGNLTAGIFAKRMGLPVTKFIASTNVNDTVPLFLSGQGFTPRTSVATISNAMDVGNPSNFGRMLDLYNNSMVDMQKDITAFVISDSETKKIMTETYREFKYILDPHGAVGLAGWNKFSEININSKGIILETAHPAKFIDAVENTLNISLTLPDSLAILKNKKKSAHLISSEFSVLKNYLTSLKA
jgi:threonine synthase